jgi:hypothetical protein
MASAKEDLLADLERLGEDGVRERLATGHYGDPGIGGAPRPLVEEWLRLRERSREDTFRSEQAAAASRAATAAERQAAAAERANTRATIALVIATSSAAVAIISTIISILK